MEKITREEAEQLYVNIIMNRGNPKYFIYRELRNWDNEDLVEELAVFNVDHYEIEEEQ